jgi:hypothetical protein
MQDADEDGVITKEVVTFSLVGDPGADPVRVSSSYVDNTPRFAEAVKPVAVAAGEGGIVRTYDEMKPWLWGGILVAAVACLLLLLFRRGVFRRRSRQ